MEPAVDREFRGFKGHVTGLHFSPDGKQLVASGADRHLMLWHLKEEKRALKLEGHKDSVFGVRFAPSGQCVASASRDATVRFWVTNTKYECKVLKAHTAAVRSLDFSPDGQTLATASDDRTVKVWSVQRQRVICSLAEHSNWVQSVRFSSDGRLVATCGDDKTLRLWDASARTCTHCWDLGGKNSRKATFWTQTGGLNLPIGTDNRHHFISHNVTQHYCHHQPHEGPVTSLSFHPGGEHLLTGSADSLVRLFDIAKGRLLYTLGTRMKPVNAVNFSGDGSYFATGGQDNQVFLWKTSCDNSDKENKGKAPSPKTKVSHEVLKELPDFATTRPSKLAYEQVVNVPPCLSQETVTSHKMQETVEQLTSQLLALSQTVAILEKRLGAAEDKIRELSSATEDPVLPTA
ncbi:unnamed protein product [Ixodes hexagonus]